MLNFKHDLLQILLVHGERPRSHGVGMEAAVDRLLAGLSELASPLLVAQQGGQMRVAVLAA